MIRINLRDGQEVHLSEKSIMLLNGHADHVDIMLDTGMLITAGVDGDGEQAARDIADLITFADHDIVDEASTQTEETRRDEQDSTCFHNGWRAALEEVARRYGATGVVGPNGLRAFMEEQMVFLPKPYAYDLAKDAERDAADLKDADARHGKTDDADGRSSWPFPLASEAAVSEDASEAMGVVKVPGPYDPPFEVRNARFIDESELKNNNEDFSRPDTGTWTMSSEELQSRIDAAFKAGNEQRLRVPVRALNQIVNLAYTANHGPISGFNLAKAIAEGLGFTIDESRPGSAD